MSDTVIRIRNLHKRFGDLHVVKGVDLEVKRGERIAIIGASGSGKSTILRCLNFMEVPSDGIIELDGKVLGAEGGGTLPVDSGAIPRPNCARSARAWAWCSSSSTCSRT